VEDRQKNTPAGLFGVKMKIKGRKFWIKGKSKYFKKKYGIFHPFILVEDTCEKALGCWRGYAQGNPSALIYAVRSVEDKLPFDSPNSGEVVYGKVNGLGELVHISELEGIKSNIEK